METTEKTQMKKYRILLIEDELYYYKRQLKLLEEYPQYEIIKAINYNAIKNRLDEDDYDLIIFDIMLPYPSSELTKDETEDGTITGYVIYNKLKMYEIKTNIVIWTRNRKMLDRSLWKENVVETIIKEGDDDNQLLGIINRNIKS